MVDEGRKKRKQWKIKHDLVLLMDFCVAISLVIILLSLVFLIDIARYLWILSVILILGFFLNMTLAIYYFIKEKKQLSAVLTVVSIGLLLLLGLVLRHVL